MKENTHQRKIISSLFILMFLFLFMILSCQKPNSPAESITINPLFTDNMVLQQKQDIPVWGDAKPGGEVIVEFNDQEKKAIVDKDGKWRVNLLPISAGGPYELSIKGKKPSKLKTY